MIAIKCFAAILGPEMAAPIFTGAWKNCLLSAGKTAMPTKFLIPRFMGGVFWFLLGGAGSADFIFMGAGIFLVEEIADFGFSDR